MSTPPPAHSILIIEFESSEKSLPDARRLLKQREIDIRHEFELEPGKILFNCMINRHPDRLYRVVLLLLCIDGVISVERFLSKGVLSS
jgi:hypothetical protein